MTAEQFARAQRYALAIAEREFPGSTPARVALRREWIEQFFFCVHECEWRDWLDWDQSESGVMLPCGYFEEFAQNLPGFWNLCPLPEGKTWRFCEELRYCLCAGIGDAIDDDLAAASEVVSC